jgi:hypothetical protein
MLIPNSLIWAQKNCSDKRFLLTNNIENEQTEIAKINSILPITFFLSLFKTYFSYYGSA